MRSTIGVCSSQIGSDIRSKARSGHDFKVKAKMNELMHLSSEMSEEKKVCPFEMQEKFPECNDAV